MIAPLTTGTELLVLDAHGVVLNRPWPAFLAEIAFATGRPPAEVRRSWRDDLHDRAWTGKMTDAELWSGLVGRATDGRDWRRRIEACYLRGPGGRALARWRERLPIWILSNHRRAWLMPRLGRFGLLAHIDRVIVSDELGVMKPDPRAFAPVLAAVSTPGAALFVDDRRRNTAAARALGLRTVLADGDDWVDAVDAAIVQPMGPVGVEPT